MSHDLVSNRTYLLIGHVTKDLLADNRFTIGGTVTYAGTVVKRLEWQPLIVTAAGPDFTPPAHLADVNWCILPSAATTTFRNNYTPQGRRQTIGPIARPLKATDIPGDCRRATLVHLCPLAQELEPSITTIFHDSPVVTTPQGWMRQWDDQGIVSLGDWRGATEILPKLQAAVISIEDIEGQWEIAEKWAALTPILIVTQDKEGCTVFHEGQTFSVPPRPSQPIDPTGAGDIFAAAFFIRFYETGNLWQSARFANVTASMAIERRGVEGVPYRAEIEAYLAEHPVEMFK